VTTNSTRRWQTRPLLREDEQWRL